MSPVIYVRGKNFWLWSRDIKILANTLHSLNFCYQRYENFGESSSSPPLVTTAAKDNFNRAGQRQRGKNILFGDGVSV